VWQRRFYDFNVWTARKRIEKLRYMHRNPVVRGLWNNAGTSPHYPYYKPTWEWRHRYSTFNDYETTTTRTQLMGTDSDFYDAWYCETHLQP
jgi:hypothetical protein